MTSLLTPSRLRDAIRRSRPAAAKASARSHPTSPERFVEARRSLGEGGQSSRRDICANDGGPAGRDLVYDPDPDPPGLPADIKRVAEVLGGVPLRLPTGCCLLIDLTWGSAPNPGSVACGDPYAPRRSVPPQRAQSARRGPRLAGAPCAPSGPNSSQPWADGPETAARDGLSREALELLAGVQPGPGPLVFLDIETTGLSGGAGTLAFLVGVGVQEGESFRIRQLFLPSYGAERAMLDALGTIARSAGMLVTFNGKSFDVPIIEMRWRYHRQDPELAGMPHLDLLHPARRLWRGGECNLAALERVVLGLVRDEDVSGFEIPGRYFQYVRYGSVEPLLAVLEHNRRDLVSLAALTARVCELIATAPDSTDDAQECLALGQLFERRSAERAIACYRRAVALSRRSPLTLTSTSWMAGTPTLPSASLAGPRRPAPLGAPVPGEREGAQSVRRAWDREVVRAEALRRLARLLRRERRYVDAADAWAQILALSCPPARPASEAAVALAIHHEHRARNLPSAVGFTQHALRTERRPRVQEALRRRLERVHRKNGGGASSA